MTAFAIYLCKVALCSGLLFLYYHAALRNRLFHQWNRFYLLIAVVLSISLPLLQFTISRTAYGEDAGTIRLLQVVESPQVFLEEITVGVAPATDHSSWLLLAYVVVALTLALFMLRALWRLYMIVRSHRSTTHGDVRIVHTNVKGTPFSFLRFIFWNDAINIRSQTGRRVFTHELVHVHEKHTLDKLFMQLVLVVFWCNPFFWLIRRELRMVHEFIADQKAVSGNGAATLAAMILQAACPQQFNGLINPFFQTSIKRRLAMISKINNPRLHYFSRIIALPLLVLVILSFTIRTKDQVSTPQLDKLFTVVVDAGHGYLNGSHSGAANGKIVEDDIVLRIANSLVAANTNPKIRIVLSRPTEQLVPLADRVAVASSSGADLFLSLHLDATVGKSGMGLYVPSKSPSYQAASELFASALQKELSDVYPVQPQLQRSASTIFVLDKNVCPAVLVECGNLSNPRDVTFFSSNNNLTAIAEKMLRAIENYAVTAQAEKNKESLSAKRSAGEFKTVVSLGIRNNDSMRLTYDDGSSEKVSKAQMIDKYGNVLELDGPVSDERTASESNLAVSISPAEKLGSASLHELLQLENTDKVVSAQISIITFDNRIFKTTQSGNAFTPESRQLIDQHIKNGKLLSVEKIVFRRNGTEIRKGAIGYTL